MIGDAAWYAYKKTGQLALAWKIQFDYKILQTHAVGIISDSGRPV